MGQEVGCLPLSDEVWEERLLFEERHQLDPLDASLPLRLKLEFLHRMIRQHLPFVHRASVVLYDRSTDLLKTFVASGEDNPVDHYQARLADSASLKRMVESRRPRVINDLTLLEGGHSRPAQGLLAAGYRASYAFPMFHGNRLFGILFFNSREAGVFKEGVLQDLAMLSHMITLLVINEVSTLRTLTGALKTASCLTRHRDWETGSHLERMARYARLIARSLAEFGDLSDEFVEHLFLFAPLHDLGKLAVPDRILLKPGPLTPAERREMECHPVTGREMVDSMLENFGLESLSYATMLRNVVEFHHEAMDGSGYPHGLKGEEIPVEARIVAVADVFDALTSSRPYKQAWSNEEAFAELRRMARSRLDPACVEALLGAPDEVEEIQRTFREDGLG